MEMHVLVSQRAGEPAGGIARSLVLQSNACGALQREAWFAGIAHAKEAPLAYIDDNAVREELLRRKAELEALSEMSSGNREAVELDQTSVGRISRIDAIQQQAMALATERNRARDLARITSALARLDAGTYGECISCGEEIGHKRLAFDAAVPTCIDCAR
jgi:DnaK suppressor protein